MNQINVVDCNNIPLEPTYVRRARQLIKNERAEWVAVNTIRMKLQYMEDNLMTVNNNEPIGADSKSLANTQPFDDDAILALAKQRLAIKKNLFYQAIDFIFIILCLASLIIIWDYNTRVLISYIFSFLWGLRLLYRVFKFVKPSFKDGIASYIKKRNDFQLESEFNRLKKEHLNNP